MCKSRPAGHNMRAPVTIRRGSAVPGAIPSRSPGGNPFDNKEMQAMTPTPPVDSVVSSYMPPKHIEAFQRAAGHFKVWILVRRGNPFSLEWIGKPGYIPKPLDCKAKTADKNVEAIQSAGLVVSPKLLPAAFSPDKLHSALEEWPKFLPLLYTFDPANPKGNLAADKTGKHYTIQTDKSHKHYACVMYKPVYRAQAEYIHADYDLYAVVAQADPKSNVFVQETGLDGQPRSRSQKLYDVQYFLKAAGVMKGQEVGSPMVRHGEQETFKTDWNEKLDVFWPDGNSVTKLVGSAKIQEFYRDTLQGRKQVDKNTVPTPVAGKWVKT